eukprot:1469019-Alexandrium_andersonii.AAC.1
MAGGAASIQGEHAETAECQVLSPRRVQSCLRAAVGRRGAPGALGALLPVSYTHLRAHETSAHL